ncbi:MAG: hypothetical protein ACKOZX_16525 [Gammaproteobacteria bacterium]
MNSQTGNDARDQRQAPASDSVDRLLGQWAADARDHQATPGLAARVVARAADTARDPIEHALYWLRAAFWRPLALCSLPVALGFLFAVTVPVTAADDRALVEALHGLAFTEWSVADGTAETNARDSGSRP